MNGAGSGPRGDRKAAAASDGSTPRAVPFYCPFCGDEDLRPHGTRHGAWLCRSCTRVFVLSLAGLAPAESTGDGDG